MARRGSQASKDTAFDHRCLCLELRRAARVVTQFYDQELRHAGLSTAQFSMLARLARPGETIQSQLAEQLTLDPTTLTRTVAPLIAKGFIRKVHHKEDRRARRLELTPAGVAQFRAAAVCWKRAQDRVRARLGDHDWTELHGLLQDVTRHTK